MDEVLIREARATDLPALLALYRQLSEGAPSAYAGERDLTPEEALPIFNTITDDPRQTLLVAEQDGQIVGTVLLELYPNLTHEGRMSGVIENMVVAPDVRREGVGRLLLDEVNRRARARNAVKLSLTSNLAREGAHRFYEALGWRHSHAGYTLVYTEEARGPMPQ